MADVEAGLVDVIVVYKVDRLTRSLADFAKIVERLDAKEASFREAKLRIDADINGSKLDADLLKLLADAMAAQQLVLASPELSLNQLGKREGRCRTQLARLLRIAWLSPRIVEAITDGSQPRMLTRKSLLTGSIPIDWSEQERQFGFAV